jgi:hypothetical protein
MKSLQLVLICWICDKRVSVETCKIDEYGQAVHEECDGARVAMKNHALPPGETMLRSFPSTAFPRLTGSGKT